MDAGGLGDFTVGEEIVGDQFRAFATATIDSGAVNAITVTDGGSTISLLCHLQLLLQEEVEVVLQRLLQFLCWYCYWHYYHIWGQWL